MKKSFKKVLFYIGGLLLLAIGINISKLAGLGISPVSAIPYALELIWGIELGKATMAFHIVFILLQILLLRRRYKPIQVLQIVCVYILGVFIRYTGPEYLLAWLPGASSYLMRIAYLLVSIVIIGIGVAFYLIPGFFPLPAEGFMQAIVDYSNNRFKFANVKVAVDSISVLISAILSLIFLRELRTVREGTILAALLVGRVVGYIYKKYRENIIHWIEN